MNLDAMSMPSRIEVVSIFYPPRSALAIAANLPANGFAVLTTLSESNSDKTDRYSSTSFPANQD
jgi:hypothetical protein